MQATQESEAFQVDDAAEHRIVAHERLRRSACPALFFVRRSADLAARGARRARRFPPARPESQASSCAAIQRFKRGGWSISGSSGVVPKHCLAIDLVVEQRPGDRELDSLDEVVEEERDGGGTSRGIDPRHIQSTLQRGSCRARRPRRCRLLRVSLCVSQSLRDQSRRSRRAGRRGRAR